MELNELPLIKRAYQMTLDDQPYPPHMHVHIVGTAPIPQTWMGKFATAEVALARVFGKKIEDIEISTDGIAGYEDEEGPLHLNEFEFYDEIKPEDDAFELVVLSINDSSELLMSGVGCTKHEIAAVGAVLNEFFDGPLREVFQAGHMPTKGAKRKAKAFCIPGQKVTLKANKREGWPEQRAKYMGTSGKECHMVTLDKKYRNSKTDDGLREVSTAQIKELD